MLTFNSKKSVRFYCLKSDLFQFWRENIWTQNAKNYFFFRHFLLLYSVAGFEPSTSELLLKGKDQRPEAGLLNKCSCLARALGVINLQTWEIWFWSYFVVLLKSDLDVQQTRLRTLTTRCLSKSKCWYSNNCLHFFKAHCSIGSKLVFD